MSFSRALVALAALFVLGGCSSFDTKWRAADGSASSRYTSRWDGRWTSALHKTVSGGPAGGRLRCVLEPVNERRVLAHFHANWLVFADDYTVPMEIAKPANRGRPGAPRKLSGSHDLPKIFGGTYRYVAEISGDEFTARYDSSYDRGTFRMTRQLTNRRPFH